jgi:hypothetical protein
MGDGGGHDRERKVRDGKETSSFLLPHRQRENRDYKYANGYKIRRNDINKI